MVTYCLLGIWVAAWLKNRKVNLQSSPAEQYVLCFISLFIIKCLIVTLLSVALKIINCNRLKTLLLWRFATNFDFLSQICTQLLKKSAPQICNKKINSALCGLADYLWKCQEELCSLQYTNVVLIQVYCAEVPKTKNS